MTTSAPCTSTIVKLDLGYVSFETTCTPTMVCGALALCTLEIDLAIEEDVPLVVFVVVLPTHDARWSAVAARVARDRGDSVCVGVAPPTHGAWRPVLHEADSRVRLREARPARIRRHRVSAAGSTATARASTAAEEKAARARSR